MFTICGIKKNGGDELEVTLTFPEKHDGIYHAIVNIEGILEDKRIYADTSFDALLNALNFLKTILDPPIPKLREITGATEETFFALEIKTDAC